MLSAGETEAIAASLAEAERTRGQVPILSLAYPQMKVILSGSFIRPIEARKGDTFHADYGPLGSVSCIFV